MSKLFGIDLRPSSFSNSYRNQARLQRNLMYLAAIADSQSQPPTMPGQVHDTLLSFVLITCLRLPISSFFICSIKIGRK